MKDSKGRERLTLEVHTLTLVSGEVDVVLGCGWEDGYLTLWGAENANAGTSMFPSRSLSLGDTRCLRVLLSASAEPSVALWDGQGRECAALTAGDEMGRHPGDLRREGKRHLARPSRALIAMDQSPIRNRATPCRQAAMHPS